MERLPNSDPPPALLTPGRLQFAMIQDCGFRRFRKTGLHRAASRGVKDKVVSCPVDLHLTRSVGSHRGSPHHLPTDVHRVPDELAAAGVGQSHPEDGVMQPDEGHGRPSVGTSRVIGLSTPGNKVFRKGPVRQIGAVTFQEVRTGGFSHSVIAQGAEGAIGVSRIIPTPHPRRRGTVIGMKGGLKNMTGRCGINDIMKHRRHAGRLPESLDAINR